MQTNQNLTDALAVIGITHKPGKIEGKRDWFGPNGEFVGSYDAHEGWEALKSSFAIASAQRA